MVLDIENLDNSVVQDDDERAKFSDWPVSTDNGGGKWHWSESQDTVFELPSFEPGAARGGRSGNPGKPPSDDPPPEDPETHLQDDWISGDTDTVEQDYFNIEIVFNGDGWTESLQNAFIESAEFLSNIIQSGFTDATITEGRGRRRTETEIDDMRIEADMSFIDGSGGTLGQAGPTWVHDTIDWIPVAGVMEFDTADAEGLLNDGYWGIVVLHEMLHTLGFGTLWDSSYMNLLEGSGSDLIFNGTEATAAYNAFLDWSSRSSGSNLDGVPVEADGGSGTAGGHWDEETFFFDELMTGYLTNEVNDYNPDHFLATWTVAALDDMGYEVVNWQSMDPAGDDLNWLSDSLNWYDSGWKEAGL